MRTVRNIVNTGRTIVCTIHQPSIDIFESFDELLLLKRGGQTIYAGQYLPPCHILMVCTSAICLNFANDAEDHLTYGMYFNGRLVSVASSMTSHSLVHHNKVAASLTRRLTAVDRSHQSQKHPCSVLPCNVCGTL